MSVHRKVGEDCPLLEKTEFEICQKCVYFRGSTYATGEARDINCNWPRNGNEIDIPREMLHGPRPEVPQIFYEAFQNEI